MYDEAGGLEQIGPYSTVMIQSQADGSKGGGQIGCNVFHFVPPEFCSLNSVFMKSVITDRSAVMT